MNKKYICAICGKENEGWGNNPYPVKTNYEDRCCDDCNTKFVIPARIMLLSNQSTKHERSN